MAAEGTATFPRPPVPDRGTACWHLDGGLGDGSAENAGWLWKGWARGPGGRQGNHSSSHRYVGNKQRADGGSDEKQEKQVRWVGQYTFHMCEACVSVPICFLPGTIDELSYPRPPLHLCTTMSSVFLRTSLYQLSPAASIFLLNSGASPPAYRHAAVFDILNKTLLWLQTPLLLAPSPFLFPLAAKCFERVDHLLPPMPLLSFTPGSSEAFAPASCRL